MWTCPHARRSRQLGLAISAGRGVTGEGKLRAPAVAVILACALSSSALAADEVILTRDNSLVAKCERLGEVQGRSNFGGMMTNFAYARTIKSLKERGQKMGATHLLMLDVSSGFSGSSALAEAFKCEQRPLPVEPLVPSAPPASAAERSSE